MPDAQTHFLNCITLLTSRAERAEAGLAIAQQVAVNQTARITLPEQQQSVTQSQVVSLSLQLACLAERSVALPVQPLSPLPAPQQQQLQQQQLP